jgi:hypothetical protein
VNAKIGAIYKEPVKKALGIDVKTKYSREVEDQAPPPPDGMWTQSCRVVCRWLATVARLNSAFLWQEFKDGLTAVFPLRQLRRRLCPRRQHDAKDSPLSAIQVDLASWLHKREGSVARWPWPSRRPHTSTELASEPELGADALESPQSPSSERSIDRRARFAGLKGLSSLELAHHVNHRTAGESDEGMGTL